MQKNRNIFFLIILFISLVQYSYAQNKMLLLNLKTDFGAKGDGKTNDQQAFEKAAKFICNRKIIENKITYRGNVKLFIPAGIYIVGYQKNLIGKIDTANNNYYKFGDDNYSDMIGCYQGVPAFIFYSNDATEKVKNVIICGDSNKTIIRFKDKMYFGAFDPQTGLVPINLNKYNRVEENLNFYLDKSGNDTRNLKYEIKNNAYHTPFATNPTLSLLPRAYVGDVIYFSYKSFYENISLINLVLDGNSNNYILGGNIGLPANKLSKRYVETYSGGIQIYNVNGLNIENVTATNFGLDGIMFRGYKMKDSISGCYNVVLKNVICTKNGRGGLAVTNVNNLIVYNSNFNENATGALQVNPGFGINLEPEMPPVCNTQFYNCKVLNNGGVAISMGYPTQETSYNHHFINCIIVAAHSNFAIVNASGACLFKNCNIYGSVLDYGVKFKTNKSNLYSNCAFSDIFLGKKVSSNDNFLWSCKKNNSLLNCTFTYTYTARALYLATITESTTGKEIPTLNEMITIKNCTFYNKNVGNKTFADKSEAAIFENNVFYYPKNNSLEIKCTNTPPFEMNIDKGKGLILK